MPVFISAKDRVGEQTNSDIATAFRQIERYTQRLETYLGVAMNINPGTQTVIDVPIGGLVGAFTTPSSTTAVTNTNANLSPTVSFPIVSGHSYLLYIYAIGHVTAGTPTFVNITATGSPIALGGSSIVSQNSPPSTSAIPGQLICPIVATSTTTEVITINIADSGAATTWSVTANNVLVQLVRVA